MQWYSVLNSVKNIYRKIIFQMGYKHRKNIAYHEGPTLKTESYNRLWGQSTSATCGLPHKLWAQGSRALCFHCCEATSYPKG